MQLSVKTDLPLISVIMPVYNCEKFLKLAVQSILAQTYTNFEFIIIDDGSSDRTNSIIDEFKLLDSRIIHISRPNKGLVYSLNEGLSLAKGKYIARMDSDDLSLPERFQEQVSLLEKGADICGCHWIKMDQDGKMINTIIAPLEIDSFVACLAYTVPFAHGSVMIRTSFLKMNNLNYGQGQLGRHAEDYELWISMFELGAKFSNVNKFLFSYRMTNDSLSNIKFKENRSDTKKLGQAFISKNYSLCLTSLNRLYLKSLSDREEEMMILMAFRLPYFKFRLLHLKKAIIKTKKKNLPSYITKAFYILLRD